MKRLFLTTTILALGGFTAAAAQTADAPSLTQAEFSAVSQQVVTTFQAQGLHTGDFQSVTRAASNKNLYRGEGSALMNTVRDVSD